MPFSESNSGRCNALAALHTNKIFPVKKKKKCQHHLCWIKSYVKDDIKAWKSACIKKPKAWSHPNHLQTSRESAQAELLHSSDGLRGSAISSQIPSAAAIFTQSCFQTVKSLTLGEKKKKKKSHCTVLKILLDSETQLPSGRVSFRAAEAGDVLSQPVPQSVRERISVQILQVWGAAGFRDG